MTTNRQCSTHLTDVGGCTGEQDAQSLSIQTIISSAQTGPQNGPAAQANADLLLSCLQGKPSPAQELANTLHALLGLPMPQASGSEATDDGIAKKGAALAELLVQRLLQTLVQQPSQLLDWRNSDLDSLSCHLVTVGDPLPASDTSADKLQAGFQAVSGHDNTAADTASLAVSVAAAPLDASERTAAAQETPVTHISHGLARMGLQEDGPGAQDIDSRAQLLGTLISGKGTVSLLTDEAVQQVLCHIKASLQSSGSESGTMILQYQAGSGQTAPGAVCCL